MQLRSTLLSNLADQFSHLKSKLFRGRLVDTYGTAYGHAKIFASGYIEFTDAMTGDKSDPAKEIYFTTHAWRVTSTDGSTVSIGRYRRAQALREAEQVVGRVLYVDDSNKIIFCRSK